MKRKETLEIENMLKKMTHDKRIYGCEEITIGFHNSGHGNEIVDFATMDSKGIIRCYEIKVTLQDLKSKAKKSWYGDYNYLITTREVYEKIDDWSEFLPDGVGLWVAYAGVKEWHYDSMIKAKKMKIEGASIMMKESMVRSLYFKMEKYRSCADLDAFKKMKKEISHLNNELFSLNLKMRKYIDDERQLCNAWEALFPQELICETKEIIELLRERIKKNEQKK